MGSTLQRRGGPGRLVLAVLSAVAALAASCSGSDSDSDAQALDTPAVVLVANTPGTLGAGPPQRVMVALVSEGPNDFLGGPDQPVSVRATPDAGEGAPVEVDGTWLTTNASTLGLYVATVTFDEAGLWEIAAVSDGQDLGSATIEVVDDPVVPGIGDEVPASDTPTATDADGIEAISTDPDPDPALYDLSIADAAANGRPTVVAFATPAFCQTALCGPTLDFVKAATSGREDLDVVHVEPFDVARARAGSLEPIPVMDDWGLVTEPWVFVLDADGRVAASFEGIIGQDELERAIDQL